jgi:aclacinomycin oxidase
VAAGGAATVGLTGTAEAHRRGAPCPPQYGGSVVGPDDPRYADLVRGWNGRFVGTPDHVRVVGSAAQVETALAEAVAGGKQLAVRSGGHCLEDLVANPDVRIVIDMSQMSAVSYDPERKAFAIEPGATLREVYKTLYTGWGVTVPGGQCPSVGAGGHFAGGGYGPLARRHGLVPDHLYAVEVVTVDRSGTPRTIVATRRRDDPNRELWWAHTGGGGGNFGVVTRYWMRSPGVSGDDPTRLLPKPPKQVQSTLFMFPWPALDQAAFTRLMRGYMEWHEHNSVAGSPAARLNADLQAPHTGTAPGVFLGAVVDPTEADAAQLLADFKVAVVDPVGVPAFEIPRTTPWLQSTNIDGYPDTGDRVGLRNKAKGSYVRHAYSDAQIATTYHYLTATDLAAPLAGVLTDSYGGQVNAAAADATAVPQRDSVLKVLHAVEWASPAEDDKHLSWVRGFYRDVHAATGGVPELDGVTDGSYVNYADLDLADPAWNTSGVPWYRIYYKTSYERLQAAKARWDPRDVFHHALSIRLPG